MTHGISYSASFQARVNKLGYKHIQKQTHEKSNARSGYAAHGDGMLCPDPQSS
jgi:hypothetical protein